ncbi:VaFE repeat-containing surface-anchored protein [Oscillospiraceae bacterium 42-9]
MCCTANMMGGKGAVAVWRTSDSSQQNFATYNVSGGDPVSCYIKVKTDAVGSAGLVKTSEDGKVSGIQFQITGSDGSSVTKTTDANGNIDLEGMPIYAADGSKITYTATELNVPNRYVKPQSQTFQLTEGQTASIQFENKLKRWRVTVTKADSKTGSTAQGNGSLKGAKFGVYQGGTLVKEYTVGEDLTFTTDYYPFGEDWTLKEISAGEGYKVSTVVTDLCEIPAGSNEEFNDNTVTVTNEVIRGGVSVQKRDSKTGEVPQGDANFAGIVFEIINDSTNTVDVDGVKVAPGKAAKEITTNAQGFATTGPNCLPYGDYIIREKSSNSSMLKTFMEEIPVTVSEDGKVYPFYADNDVVRGGIAIEKRDSKTALPFDTYCLEELRCEGNKGYELVTVPNITISRDSTVIELGTIDDHEEENPEIGTTATVNDEKLAEPLSEVTIVDTVRYSGLTAGKTYKLSGVLMDKESGKPLEVDGKQVTAEKEFTPTKSSGTVELSYTFNASTLAGKSVVVFEDLYEGEKKVTSHADIEDEGQTVTFTEPKIGTTATANGEHTAEPIGEITIIDTVAYSELIVGKEYTVKGVLMDKATGEKLLVDGKEVTAEATFRASKPEGTIDIPFTFDASALAGKTVVAFETLYRDKLEVCAHTDIEDKEQTVTFSEKPEIKTTATVNDEKKAEPAGEVTIVDTVTYSGLTPGKTYKLSGVLMDKASNAPLLVDGQKITAEKEFTPENASGTEEITFTLDATALPGKSVVVFETLYHEDREVTSHADIKDEGQTVEFEKPDEPEIKTTATVNGEKKAEPAGEVTIVDTVSYTGLTPGKTYKLSGILMDKATGKPLEIDGNQVTAEKEFTPEKASGTEEITFTFDASVLAGKSVVVFETLYHEDKEVTAHTDINDEDQTVTFEEPDKPKIKTEATVNGEKEADPLEEITLIDKVTYSNLVPGKEYQVKGVLMDKSTGKKLLVDGKEVTSETTFTPDKAEGSVELSFTFNASGLAGKSIVAYETLYHKDIEVAVHADIDDEDQTVTIKDGPKLKTTATIGGKKEATISKEIVLDDKIAYTGLTPGKEYTVKGVLMDKSTGEKLLVDGKEVTAETTFTPEKPDGEVTVSFKFDASGFKEKIETVVFETLYLGDKEIASHADINDKDQTVTLVPEKPKTPTTDVPKTGDDRSLTMPLIMMCVFFAGLLAAIFFWYRFCDRRTGSKKNRR